MTSIDGRSQNDMVAGGSSKMASRGQSKDKQASSGGYEGAGDNAIVHRSGCESISVKVTRNDNRISDDDYKRLYEPWTQ